MTDHEAGCADVLDSVRSRLDADGEAEVDALIASLRWASQAGQPDWLTVFLSALRGTLAFFTKNLPACTERQPCPGPLPCACVSSQEWHGFSLTAAPPTSCPSPSHNDAAGAITVAAAAEGALVDLPAAVVAKQVAADDDDDDEAVTAEGSSGPPTKCSFGSSAAAGSARVPWLFNLGSAAAQHLIHIFYSTMRRR